MITREEMEKVWANGRVGWLKDHSKKSKKLKPFTVTVTPYTKNYMDPVVKKVWAKSAKDAQYERPYDELRALYPQHFEKSEHGDHYWPKKELVTETRVREGHE
jgi:hypothetical protein